LGSWTVLLVKLRGGGRERGAFGRFLVRAGQSEGCEYLLLTGVGELII